MRDWTEDWSCVSDWEEDNGMRDWTEDWSCVYDWEEDNGSRNWGLVEDVRGSERRE
jgi:hypothetical protein